MRPKQWKKKKPKERKTKANEIYEAKHESKE